MAGVSAQKVESAPTRLPRRETLPAGQPARVRLLHQLGNAPQRHVAELRNSLGLRFLGCPGADRIKRFSGGTSDPEGQGTAPTLPRLDAWLVEVTECGPSLLMPTSQPLSNKHSAKFSICCRNQKMKIRAHETSPLFQGDRYRAIDILSQLTTQCESGTPDGRSLYSYNFTHEQFLALEELLQDRFYSSPHQHTAAAFVFWASEHIRATFEGGPLTWKFVFDGIRWPEDQDVGRDLTADGLRWWGRNTRVSEAGQRMYLYSLMAEGGIPASLLQNHGLYRDVVLGVLKEIEREGGASAKDWAYDIAWRWVQRLPQTFKTSEVGRLLAELSLALVELRAELPIDLPESAAVPWLNQHSPDWLTRVPLRMTGDVAESLIHPVLKAERTLFNGSYENICRRELTLDRSGEWRGYLVLHDEGWLPGALFPKAEGLRIRLLPTGEHQLHGVTYSGTPVEDGWQLRRFGSNGSGQFPLPPQAPLALAAFADGRSLGEAVVDPGISGPDECPTFWRTVDPKDGTGSSRLTPVVGEKKTRGPCLWIWTTEGSDPEIEGDVLLDDIADAPNGYLWRLSGTGALYVGNRRFRVHTGSEGEGSELRLFATGETLGGWRLDGNTPVFLGRVTFYGKRGSSGTSRIPTEQLRSAPGSALYGQVVEWVQREETLASCTLVRVPDSARLELRETAPGCLLLNADGFKSAKRITLAAGHCVEGADLSSGSATLSLDVRGAPPGTVEAALSDPKTGASVNLKTTWPSLKGVIVGPDDRRLEQNSPLAVESLYGWRAITPDNRKGDLQLRLQGERAIALPVVNECSLAAHRPLIQAMLAQGGPDAQVNLSLVVGGEQSKRLEIRRYHKKAAILGEELFTGLDRNKTAHPKNSLGTQIKRKQTITYHAVNMSNPEICKSGETSAVVNLADLLGENENPWLIQTRYQGKAQRPVVWSAAPPSTRAGRIEHYKTGLRQLLSDGENDDWGRLEKLITAARQGGDAGALDEVQAFAGVPAAALSLAIRGADAFQLIQELDMTVPIFWPSVRIAEFEMAVRCEHNRLVTKLSALFERDRAVEAADDALLRRVGQVMILMPELSTHFGSALMEVGVLNRVLRSHDSRDLLRPFVTSKPEERLAELAQQAVRRFDRLPSGIRALELENRPPHLRFNRYAQAVVDAPLVSAVMSAGLRPAPNLEERLTLINLRAVDPLYFNAALPAALEVAQARSFV